MDLDMQCCDETNNVVEANVEESSQQESPPSKHEEQVPRPDNTAESESEAQQTDMSSSSQTELELPTSANPKQKNIALHAEFNSFLELRDAIHRYQKEKSVQLIVKDSKLLKADSTKKIIRKVHHLVKRELLYHSITYCCKCHGELKQKPNTRVKNVGSKRLNCPMYFRLKLSPDLQRLVLYDMDETHNHDIDPTTAQMTPRQQIYTLSRMLQGKRPLDEEDSPSEPSTPDVGSLIATAIKDVSSVPGTNYQPTAKVPKIKVEIPEDRDNGEVQTDRPESPLDSETESSCSDSDDETTIRRRLLPFPIRLIGSAVKSSPDLIAASKQIIELQKTNLQLEKRRLLAETKMLEMCTIKLELEVKKMERSLASDSAEGDHVQDTTIYLQAS